MQKLDARLNAISVQIRATTHVDVGSDHGRLLASLIHSGRIERGIAIENKQGPYRNSIAALKDLPVDVRLGDGLAPLCEGEADSLSICGMGGEAIVRIVEAFPQRVPPQVCVQPNRHPELVRRWALRSGFHIKDEQTVGERWRHVILTFAKCNAGEDPAYDGLDRDAALLFGPLIIKRKQPAFLESLERESQRMRSCEVLCEQSRQRQEAICKVLETHGT